MLVSSLLAWASDRQGAGGAGGAALQLVAASTEMQSAAKARLAEMQSGVPSQLGLAHLLLKGAHFPNEGIFGILDHVPILLSGASEGADTLFGAAAMRAHHGAVYVLGPRNQPSAQCAQQQQRGLYPVADTLLDSAAVSTPFEYAASARSVGPHGSQGTLEDWRDSRRNYLQVCGASVVYVVAYRLNPGPQTPPMDIGGGTGFACQMYIDRFAPRGTEDPSRCHLYLFDDGAPGWPGCLKDPSTHRKWSRWDALRQAWRAVPSADGLPPTVDAFFADGAAAAAADVRGHRRDHPQQGVRHARRRTPSPPW